MGDLSGTNAANQYLAPGRALGSIMGGATALGAAYLGGPMVGGAMAAKFLPGGGSNATPSFGGKPMPNVGAGYNSMQRGY